MNVKLEGDSIVLDWRSEIEYRQCVAEAEGLPDLLPYDRLLVEAIARVCLRQIGVEWHDLFQPSE